MRLQPKDWPLPQSAHSRPTARPQSAHSEPTVSSQRAHSEPTVMVPARRASHLEDLRRSKDCSGHECEQHGESFAPWMLQEKFIALFSGTQEKLKSSSQSRTPECELEPVGCAHLCRSSFRRVFLHITCWFLCLHFAWTAWQQLPTKHWHP